MNNYFDAEIFKPFEKESLQYRILAAYIKFHKEDADKLSLLYKDRMTPQGNPLFIAISKDMDNLIGKKKKVSNQTLWRLFFESNYFPSATKEKDIEDYIKAVDKVIFIRKLKADILKKFSDIHKNDKFSFSAQNPNVEFTAQLARDIKKYSEGGKVSSTLDKDIPKLFLKGNNEHEISYETIDNLSEFIKKGTIDKENDFSQKNPPPKSRKGVKWWLFPLLFIIGLLIVIYFVFSNMGNRAMDTFDTVIGENIKGEFNPDPSGKGMGFLSINDTLGKNTANMRDTLYLPKLEKGESSYFVLYVDYHNYGAKEIKKATAKIFILDTIYGNGYSQYKISSQLSGEDVASIFDTTLISNIPERATIKFMDGYIENTHGSSDPHFCSGYDYIINIDNDDLSSGISLDVLDTFKNGWCDQGYLIVTFMISSF